MTWTVLPADSQILAIHVALLSNGKILIFPGDQQRGSATDFEHARLFNPTSGSIEPCPAPKTDVFCSGHAFLGDGRIVVGGGTLRYSAEGHVHGAGEVSPFSGERSTWLYPSPTVLVEKGGILRRGDSGVPKKAELDGLISL